jgi:exopolysaccharide production protein ExoZ
LAALSVAVFHVTLTANQTFYAIPVLSFAAAGVDVFFVISGFIMWVAGRDQTPVDFFKKRITRIVPLYWSVTIALYFGWLLVGHAAPAVIDFLRSLMFIPFLADNGEAVPVLVVGWTLNYEMFFYLLFALSLMAPKMMRATVLLSTIGILAFSGVVWQFAPPWQLYTSPLLLEFACGVLLAMAFCGGRTPRRPIGLILVLIGACSLVLSELHPPAAYSHWRLIAWGLPAVCIVAGTLSFDGKFFSRILKAAGDSSYSIYLTHTLVISAIKHALLALGINSLTGGVLLIALGIPASGLFGFAVYSLIERPLLAYVRSDRRHANSAAEPPYPA